MASPFDNAPARVRNCVTHHGCDCREYVMERLPAYEAAREALTLLLDEVQDGWGDDWTDGMRAAEAALARLRDEVPA